MLSTAAEAQTTPEPLFPAEGTDRPDTYVEPTDAYDYVKRSRDAPMRDGTKLYTVIVMKKGTQGRADPAVAHAL